MRTFDEKKLAKLHSINGMMNNELGKPGTPERNAFHDKSMAWYYGEILRERRKELRLTQQELADRIGIKRSYITKIEKGETDMQLSSFIRIANALKVNISLSPDNIVPTM